VDPRAGLDDLEKRKFLKPLGLELGTFCRPARSQSLYRLRYPGSSPYKVLSLNILLEIPVEIPVGGIGTQVTDIHLFIKSPVTAARQGSSRHYRGRRRHVSSANAAQSAFNVHINTLPATNSLLSCNSQITLFPSDRG
jgi:hypothetical protein